MSRRGLTCYRSSYLVRSSFENAVVQRPHGGSAPAEASPPAAGGRRPMPAEVGCGRGAAGCRHRRLLLRPQMSIDRRPRRLDSFFSFAAPQELLKSMVAQQRQQSAPIEGLTRTSSARRPRDRRWRRSSRRSSAPGDREGFHGAALERAVTRRRWSGRSRRRMTRCKRFTKVETRSSSCNPRSTTAGRARHAAQRRRRATPRVDACATATEMADLRSRWQRVDELEEATRRSTRWRVDAGDEYEAHHRARGDREDV